MIPGKGALGAPAFFTGKALRLSLFLFFPWSLAAVDAPRPCDDLRAYLSNSPSLGAEKSPGLDLACQAILLKLEEGRSKRIPPPLLRRIIDAIVDYTRLFREQAATNAGASSLLEQRPVYGYLADFAAGSIPFPHFLALQQTYLQRYPKEVGTFFASCDAYLLSVSFGVSKGLALESVAHLSAASERRPALGWLDAFYTHAETHQMDPDRAARILLTLSGPLSHKRLLQAVDDFR